LKAGSVYGTISKTAINAGEDINEKCVETKIHISFNLPSGLPAKSYLLFYKNKLKQEFWEEFYEIAIPYSTGAGVERGYSFQNLAGDTEYIIVRLQNPIAAGSQTFTFNYIRNAAGNNLTFNYNVQVFDLQRMILHENLGNTVTLLSTGGIKNIDNFAADLDVNPFTFFTFGNPHLQRVHFQTCEELHPGSRIEIRYYYPLSFNFIGPFTKCRVNENVFKLHLNYTHPDCS
jgi:hypothetical protein